ncbi:MAG: cyclase family protein [Aestuariibacter sp.]
MKLTMTLQGEHYAVDVNDPISLAIPVHFNGQQPNHFGVPEAKERAIKEGDFVGDTREGGSCNVSEITFIPHCNGTHTESIGHIVDEKQGVAEVINNGLMPAALISVSPKAQCDVDEQYRPAPETKDCLITRQAIEQALQHYNNTQLQAVVIRTLSHQDEKLTAKYGDGIDPPFLSIDAIDYLVSRGVQHLIVDIPSVDKMYDEGLLTVHHRFWQVEEETHHLHPDSAVHRTITEMVYIADEVADGFYLLDLQVPAFMSDAAPSKPLLYRLEKL